MKYVNFFRYIAWAIAVFLLIVVLSAWHSKRVSENSDNTPTIILAPTPSPTAAPVATATPTFVPYDTGSSVVTTGALPATGPTENGIILAGLLLIGSLVTFVRVRNQRLQAALASVEIR
jgi:hypothetical protein